MAPIFKIATILSFSLYVAAQGTQFITGVCTSDAQCASACCGFTSGKCAAPFVANERGEGCGFGNAQPNNNALGASKGQGQAEASPPVAPVVPVAAESTETAVPDTPEPTTTAVPDTPEPTATAASAPKAPGTQFITGPCTSDADCAAGCCGFKSGKCAGAVIAQERDGGCGFGNAQPNDNAAKALQGKRLGRRGPAYM